MEETVKPTLGSAASMLATLSPFAVFTLRSYPSRKIYDIDDSVRNDPLGCGIPAVGPCRGSVIRMVMCCDELHADVGSQRRLASTMRLLPGVERKLRWHG